MNHGQLANVFGFCDDYTGNGQLGGLGGTIPMEQLFLKPPGQSLDRFEPMQGLQGGMSLSQVCTYL
jgi:hypothetical protein